MIYIGQFRGPIIYICVKRYFRNSKFLIFCCNCIYIDSGIAGFMKGCRSWQPTGKGIEDEIIGEEFNQNNMESSGDRPPIQGEKGSYETNLSMPPDPWSNHIRD